jgi:hypothetical protein
VGLAEPLRQTGCLLSEEQKAVVPKDSLGIVPRRLGGSQPQIRGWVLGKEVVQIRVDTQIHHGPVIQSGPADRFLTDVEAQRLYQMKAAAGGGTGAGNIAAVLRDLRFYKYNIQHDWPSLAYRVTLYSKSGRNSTIKWSKNHKKIKKSP